MDINNFATHPFVVIHKISFLKEKIIDYILKREMDLSFSQYMVLVFYDFFPNISQHGIAELRNCTEASISRTTKLLIKKGLLEVGDIGNDRRTKKLRLTNKGKTLLKNAKKIVNKEFDSFCSVMTKNQKRETFEILDKVWKKVFERGENLNIIKYKNHLKNKQ